MLKNVLGFFFRAIFRFLAMSCFHRATPITIYIWFFIIMLFYFIGRLILMLFMKEWQKTTRQKKTRKVNLFRCGSEIAEAIYVLGRLSLSYFRVCAAQLKQVSRWLYLNYKMWLLLMFSSHANFRECVFFCTRRTLSIEITFLLFWLARHKRFNSFFSFQFSHKLWAKTFALQQFLLFSIVFPLLFQWLWRQFSFFFSTPLCNV